MQYRALILRTDSLDGCTWYRLKQFKKHAEEQNLIDVQFMNFNLPVDMIQKALEVADLYLVRLSDQTALNLLENISVFDLKKPVVVDIDDNYDNIDPLSDLYHVYGTQEVRLSDGTYLWRDGESRFSIEENKRRLDKFHKIMQRSTAIITTTFNLKNYAQQFNKNAVIIPNSIDLDLFPQLDIRRSNEVRIMWSGGSTHYPDLIEIAPTLGEIMRAYPQVHFYLYGVEFEGIVKYLPKERVHTKGWINADGHGYRLACTDPDIGICPLKDMEFNYYKSSVKYYEMASLGIPVLARNIAPYNDDIIDGQNGLLYKDNDTFRDRLIQLINDPIKRIKLGQSGYEYVKQYRNVSNIVKDWADFLNSIIKLYRTV